MLHNIRPTQGSRKNRKRIARGNSGKGGTTAGRGTKGQLSRSGNRKRLGFEGGQTPLLIRQPKLGGFNNPNRVEHEAINLSDIERLESGSYDTASLRENKIARTKKPIKILGKGKVTKKYELKVEAASKVAVEAIEKAGGKIVIG